MKYLSLQAKKGGWVVTKKWIVLLIATMQLLFGAFQWTHAETMSGHYEYYKNIVCKEPATKYKAVFLDEEIYKYALSDLKDIRIVDGKGVPVAYYVQNGYSKEQQDKTVYNTKLLRQYKEKNDTLFDFQVMPPKDNTDVIGNLLKLEVLEQNFAKSITVYGSYDNIEWQNILIEDIYKVENVEKTDISLKDRQKYKYYRLRIPNNLEKINIQNLQVMNIDLYKSENDFERHIQTRFEIENINKESLIIVHNPNRVKIKNIQLDTEGNFKRRYQVYIKDPKDQEDKTKQYIGRSDNIYNLALKDLNVSQTSIDFSNSPVTSELIMIQVENGDDRPIHIKGITADYYLDKVVFESVTDANYKLLFGNRDAQKPSYDIALYKENIEKEKQEICTLSKLYEDGAADQKAGKNKYLNLQVILNLVIGAVSLLLIFLIARKLA